MPTDICFCARASVSQALGDERLCTDTSLTQLRYVRDGRAVRDLHERFDRSKIFSIATVRVIELLTTARRVIEEREVRERKLSEFTMSQPVNVASMSEDKEVCAVAAVNTDYLSGLSRLTLMNILRLVGNIRSNDCDEQTFDSTMPVQYTEAHLRKLRTPITFDLQSAAALACVSRATAAAWRDLQTSDLLDHFQAIMRGRAIVDLLETHIPQASFGDDNTRVAVPANADGADNLVIVNGRINLPASMRVVESRMGRAIPKLPRGWRDEDCLLVVYPDSMLLRPYQKKCEWIVCNALVGKFGTYEAARKAACALSGVLRPMPMHTNEHTERFQSAYWWCAMLQLALHALGETEQVACPLAWLRRQFGAGIKPAMPAELFSAELQQRSMYDITRVEPDAPYEHSFVHRTVTQWRAFHCWSTMRKLGMYSAPLHRAHQKAIGRQPRLDWYTVELAETSDPPRLRACDSLFETGSSRFYHSFELKLSRYGIVSAADCIVQTVFLSGRPLPWLFNGRGRTNEQVLGDALPHMRFEESWLRMAATRQFYAASIARESKSNPFGSLAAFIVPTARRTQLVDTSTSLGRSLDRIWQQMYAVKSHEAECNITCRDGTAKWGVRHTRPTLARALPQPTPMDGNTRQMPALVFSSETGVDDVDVGAGAEHRAAITPPPVRSMTPTRVACRRCVCR